MMDIRVLGRIWLQNEDDEDNDDENWLSVVHLSRMVKDFTTPRDSSIVWLLLLWMCGVTLLVVDVLCYCCRCCCCFKHHDKIIIIINFIIIMMMMMMK
jgi:hypothetical protein